jgi:hypothetical protein
MGASGGNGPRGADDNVMTLVIEFGALTHQFHHTRPVKLACAAGQYTGTKLDNNPFVVSRTGRHACKYP